MKFYGKAPVRISLCNGGDTDYYIDILKWTNLINATLDSNYYICEVEEKNQNYMNFGILCEALSFTIIRILFCGYQLLLNIGFGGYLMYGFSVMVYILSFIWTSQMWIQVYRGYSTKIIKKN